MELRLDEIRGLMISPKEVPYCFDDNSITEHQQKALTQQGKRKITMNREKLAERLYNRYENHKNGKIWKDALEITKRIWRTEADELLSHLNELIESVPTCSVCNSNPCQSTCSKQQFPIESVAE